MWYHSATLSRLLMTTSCVPSIHSVQYLYSLGWQHKWHFHNLKHVIRSSSEQHNNRQHNWVWKLYINMVSLTTMAAQNCFYRDIKPILIVPMQYKFSNSNCALFHPHKEKYTQMWFLHPCNTGLLLSLMRILWFTPSVKGSQVLEGFFSIRLVRCSMPTRTEQGRN